MLAKRRRPLACSRKNGSFTTRPGTASAKSLQEALRGFAVDAFDDAVDARSVPRDAISYRRRLFILRYVCVGLTDALGIEQTHSGSAMTGRAPSGAE